MRSNSRDIHAICWLILFFCGNCLADYMRPQVCTEYANSPAVFTGKVLSQRRVEMEKDRDPGWVYRVRVTKTFKSSLRGIVEVYTSDTTIRFPLKVGVEYVLFPYANSRPGAIEIGEPTNSGPLSRRLKTISLLRGCSPRRH